MISGLARPRAFLCVTLRAGEERNLRRGDEFFVAGSKPKPSSCNPQKWGQLGPNMVPGPLQVENDLPDLPLVLCSGISGSQKLKSSPRQPSIDLLPFGVPYFWSWPPSLHEAFSLRAKRRATGITFNIALEAQLPLGGMGLKMTTPKGENHKVD